MTTMKTMERQFALRAQIKPDPNQPRKEFNNLETLAESLKGGILETLKVRAEKDHYVLIDGERRWRAAGLAGIDRLPIEVVEAKDVAKMQFTFGTQRENLTALEEARAAQGLLEERRKANPKFAVADLGKELGKERAATYELLALNKVSKPVREALVAGKLDASKARLFATVPEDRHGELLKLALEQDYYGTTKSVRKLRELIERDYTRQLNDAPFPTKTEWKVGTASRIACASCSLRSGNIESFTGNPNICTAVTCFDARVKDFNAQTLADAKAKGARVVEPAEYSKGRYSKFVEEGEEVWDGKKHVKLTTLAKKAGIAPAVTVDLDNKVISVFTNADAEAIKKASGIKERAYDGGQDTEALKKYRAKLKNMLAQAEHAAAKMLPVFVTDKGINPKLWTLLADAIAREMGIERAAFIAMRRGLCDKKTLGEEKIEAWLTDKARTDRDRQEFIVEALICAQWDEGGWHECGWADDFKDAAKIAGVDLDKLPTMPPLTPTSQHVSLAEVRAKAAGLKTGAPKKPAMSGLKSFMAKVAAAKKTKPAKKKPTSAKATAGKGSKKK